MQAVLQLLRGHGGGGGHDTFFRVLLTAVQIVIGLMVAKLVAGKRAPKRA